MIRPSPGDFMAKKYDDDDDVDVESIRKDRIDRATLRSIAVYQKVILVCILVYILSFVAQFFVPTDLRWMVGIPVLLVVLTATVFVFLLSTKVYSVAIGVLLGLLTLIPCIGLIALLIINSKATGTLKANGISVGLLGADLSQIQE